MTESDLHVIVNPESSSGKGRKVAPRLIEALLREDIPHVVTYTDAPGDAVGIAREAARAGAKRVLAVGGDGTIHEVVNGLLTADVAVPNLAVLPVGTGNDFYHMVGAGKTISDVLAVLKGGRVRTFDVGMARWDDQEQYFVNLLGMGIDVEVLRKRESFTRLSGLAQYVAALVSALVGFKAVPVRVRVGDEVLEGTTMLSAVTVGPSVAGGIMLSPTATPTDGELDLCRFDDLGFFQTIRTLPRVIRGTHGTLKGVTMRRFTSARLEAPTPEPFWFELDGEVVPKPTKAVDISIAAGVLPVLVPASS